MKKIEAVIKPFKIDDVKEALEKVGVRGITISEAKGLGRQRGFTEVNTGVEYGDFLPKIRLEIILQDDLSIRPSRRLELQQTQIVLVMVKYLFLTLKQL